MAKAIFNKLKSSAPFWVCLIVSLALIVGSFFVPPMGVIDGSVLRAVGEIFAYATLWVVWSAIKSGIDARLTHGNTKIEFGDLNKTEVDNEETIE